MMSRLTTFEEEARTAIFAKKAACCFRDNSAITTYTESGRIMPGELFAMRWGMGNDCVLVFRISEDFQPVNFQQAFREAKP